MKKYFFFVVCCLFSLSLFAENNEVIEQGATNYYFSSTGNEKYLKDFDPISAILHEKLMAGFTRAATKCYFIQLDPKVHCPDYAIGHAVMKTGAPRTQICTAAKRAAVAPQGCQRKHCTPCTYDSL